jgi:hypothetical protein
MAPRATRHTAAAGATPAPEEFDKGWTDMRKDGSKGTSRSYFRGAVVLFLVVSSF